jgi:hypothetical protein
LPLALFVNLEFLTNGGKRCLVDTDEDMNPKNPWNSQDPFELVRTENFAFNPIVLQQDATITNVEDKWQSQSQSIKLEAVGDDLFNLYTSYSRELRPGPAQDG